MRISGKIDDALTATDINFVKGRGSTTHGRDDPTSWVRSSYAKLKATQMPVEPLLHTKANKAQSYVEQQPLEAKSVETSWNLVLHNAVV